MLDMLGLRLWTLFAVIILTIMMLQFQYTNSLRTKHEQVQYDLIAFMLKCPPAWSDQGQQRRMAESKAFTGASAQGLGILR